MKAEAPEPGSSRLMRFLAPIAAGLLLDAIDLLTFGTIGLWTGLVVGGSAGWLLSPYLGFSARHRWLGALLAGVYCTLPFTSFMPLAGVLAAASNFLTVEAGPLSGHLPSDEDRRAIDAEYSVGAISEQRADLLIQLQSAKLPDHLR